jgi:hypothetical protein
MEPLPLSLLASGTDSVLIDNSTYFSAKGVIHYGVLDSAAIFNLSTLVEAIVFNERVFLAPTSTWRPNAGDAPLFEKGGPCISLDPAQMWDEFVPTVRAALIGALGDLNSPYRPYPGADARQAAHIIINWLVEVERNPSTFLSTYSAQVHYADPASLLVMEQIPDSGPAGRIGALFYRGFRQHTLRQRKEARGGAV